MTSGLKQGMLQGILCLTVSGLALAAFGQNAPQGKITIAPVPADPLELATGQIQVARMPANRAEALQLLARARNNYQLRNAQQPWDLKVRFTVDSHGETNYDGAWLMEDRFVPGQGLHWTAKSASGYSITGIFAPKATYSEPTPTAIPLRLQEARSMLYNPLPSVDYAGSGSIRTFHASFHGASVTCLLLAHSRNVQNPAVGRGWEENEECIDPQSGLLLIHSEAPGRYIVYDYASAPRLGDRLAPASITVSEGGRIVSKIQVESLEGRASFEASLFVPTERMKAAQAPVMTSLQKISRIVTDGQAGDSQGEGAAAVSMAMHVVCVFGMVNSAGQLVEAHSLQPSDPNSQAALKDAKAIDFSAMITPGAPPQQHFVFVIEKFISPE
jgi:hypothetical protein